MLAALSRKHIAQGGPAWGGPALGPRSSTQGVCATLPNCHSRKLYMSASLL